jgi:hypothetical protein
MSVLLAIEIPHGHKVFQFLAHGNSAAGQALSPLALIVELPGSNLAASRAIDHNIV